jgi:hypothetical protein
LSVLHSSYFAILRCQTSLKAVQQLAVDDDRGNLLDAESFGATGDFLILKRIDLSPVSEICHQKDKG